MADEIIDPFDGSVIPGIADKPKGRLTAKDKAWLETKLPNWKDRSAAGARAFNRSVIPSGGAAAGAVLGGEIGAFGGPLAPFTVPIGALIGGVGGALAGDHWQKTAMKAFPEVAKATGQTPEQIAQDETRYPLTTGAATFGPSLVGGGALQRVLTPKGALSAPFTVTAPQTPSLDATFNATRNAAERQGLRLPSTVTSPTGYRLSRVIPNVVGTGAIDKAEKRAPEEVSRRLKELSGVYMRPTERGAAGEAVQRGAGRWMENARTTGGDLIEQSHKFAGDLELAPTSALKAVDEKIALLQGNEVVNRDLLKPLFEIRGDLMSGKPMTLQRFHDLRSSLYRKSAPEGFDASFKAWLRGDVYQAMTQDIRAGLATAANEGNENAMKALTSFEQGNAVWAKRKEVYNRALKKVLGADMVEDLSDPSRPVLVAEKAPEAAWDAVRSMTADDRRAFAKTMGTLSQGEQDTVRASVIASLGRDAQGNFVPSRFLADMHKLPVPTRVVLFGRDSMQAMDDLQTVVKNLEQIEPRQGGWGQYAAPSAFASLLGLGGAGVAGGAGTFAAMLGGSAGMAHLLAKPDTLKWLGKLASASSKGTEAFGKVMDELRVSANSKASLWPLYDNASRAVEAAAAGGQEPEIVKAKPFAPEEMSDDEIDAILGNMEDASEPEPSRDAGDDEGATLDLTSFAERDRDGLLQAVAVQESGGNPKAVSPKGAEGVMQVMPGTQASPGFGVRPAADGSPEEKTRTGVDYLRAMLDRYGNQALALMAYNWGPGNVDKWLEGGMKGKVPRETREYVASILGE